ncbi:L-threonylcarbamoyladenylate synthase [Alkalibacillus aidingensis]|uniref:L-threonylcarbamoyladenylate synthase n=1 Tax=Alkalibacillus aidingensis TaxID=2747607 RepID=UPI0016612208|nr:L-threonylcarbamoyladenylate synthase [Alkalibacillus aidingensis]
MAERHETKQWSVPNSEPLMNHPSIKEAAEWLKQGKTVAFPTETVYGLGADATNEAAVQKIFEAKGRPADNPLIVHVGKVDTVKEYVKEIPSHAWILMNEFWPGPLTIILPSKGVFADNVTAGLETVGIRIPDHPHAIALLTLAAIPVAAPSANRSGKPSPTSSEHVMDDLKGRIHGVLDGGQTGVGVESTVIDCTLDRPMILRPGGVTKEEIEATIGPVDVAPSLLKDDDAPRSPGMKYKHYAPDVPIWIVEGGAENMNKVANELKQQGKHVGFMVSQERAQQLGVEKDLILGERSQLNEMTSRLYDQLRKIDQLNYDIVLAESFSKIGIGVALMNRLERAASKIIE